MSYVTYSIRCNLPNYVVSALDHLLSHLGLSHLRIDVIKEGTLLDYISLGTVGFPCFVDLKNELIRELKKNCKLREPTKSISARLDDQKGYVQRPVWLWTFM